MNTLVRERTEVLISPFSPPQPLPRISATGTYFLFSAVAEGPGLGNYKETPLTSLGNECNETVKINTISRVKRQQKKQFVIQYTKICYTNIYNIIYKHNFCISTHIFVQKLRLNTSSS